MVKVSRWRRKISQGYKLTPIYFNLFFKFGFPSSLPSRYYPGPMLLTSEIKCELVSLTRYEPLVFNICATENSSGKNLMLVFEVSWP